MIELAGVTVRNLVVPSLALPPGTTAVIGPNGSGKTTLLRLIAGLAVPAIGTIRIDGKEPSGVSIGFVNEYPDRNILFPRVFDEIAGPLRFRHLPCTAVEGGVLHAAEEGGFSRLLDRETDTLSGGEKVLLGVLSAVVSRPDVLVLDEFDSHLDPSTLARADRLIAGSGAGYVVRCTQNMDLAARCGNVIALFAGRVHASGGPDEVFSGISGTCFYPLSWRLSR